MGGFTASGINVTTVTTTQQSPLGFELTRESQDKGLSVWLYVYNDEPATAFAVGDVIGRDPLGIPDYKAVVSTGAIVTGLVLGVAQHAIAAKSYGFILKSGIGLVKVNALGTLGGGLIADAVAGTATDGAAGDFTFGTAFAAGPGTVDARLYCVG